MLDEIKEFHIEQQKKLNTIHEAGVRYGIMFAVEKLMVGSDYISLNETIDKLIKEYKEVEK